MAVIGSVNPAISDLNRVSNDAQRITQRIATGSNFPSASYDGAAYAITQRVSSNVGALGQSVQNNQNASAMLRVAAGATGNTVDALTEIRANLVNAANGTNSDNDRAALQQNINQLVRQIDTNANASYNGMNLLDGTRNGITVAGINGYENVGLGDMRAQALGLADSRGNVQINLDTDENIQAALRTVDTAIEFVGGVNDGLNDVVNAGGFALDEALDEATTQGAQLQRLDYQAANYATAQENEMNAAAAIDNADIAKQAMMLRNRQVQEQLALFAASMFNHSQASVLNLLR